MTLELENNKHFEFSPFFRENRNFQTGITLLRNALTNCNDFDMDREDPTLYYCSKQNHTIGINTKITTPHHHHHPPGTMLQK